MQPPEFWSRPQPGLAAWSLRPCGAVMTALGRRRRARTDGWRAPIPVVCVGGVTLGGQGKTPTALALAELALAAGRRPFFLTRGWKGRLRGPLLVDLARHGAAEVGDEPLLLAGLAPTVVAVDRAAGARFAVEQGAGLILMDDGHQNPLLVKDVSLVVIDGGAGFGNGCVFPAGPLREPLADGFARADAAVLVGEDRWGAAASLPASLPLLRARLVPSAETAALAAGRRLFAFAGIGRPQKFFDMLTELGAELAGAEPFADHHPYSPADAARLVDRAAALGAALITTAKDRVRLPADFPALVATVRLAWDDAATAAHVLNWARGAA